jgi:hypothetical protein
VRRSSDLIGQVMPLATWRIVSQGKQPRIESTGSLSPLCRRCQWYEHFPNVALLMFHFTFARFNVTEFLNICVVRTAVFRITMVTSHSSMALQHFVGPWPLLQFRNLYTQTVGPLGRVISLSRGLCLHIEQHKHRVNAQIDIRDLSGIRTHNPSVRASEDSSCLRPRGHCDRHHGYLATEFKHK